MSLQKVIYIHINKCGGTSIKSAIRNLDNVFIPKNDNIVNLIGTPLWNSHIKISVVRNPYDRIKSLYGMLMRQGKRLSLDDMLNILTNDKIPYKTNDGFLPTGDSYIKRHGLPMTHKHYGICNGDKIIVDKIYNLENINEHWNDIQTLIGFDVKLPHKNTSKSNLIKLTNKQMKIIQEYYDKDFNLLGYEK